jgi:hypothetical protein
MRKLLAAGLVFAGLTSPAAAQEVDAIRTDADGARQLLAELALTPPALYPERLPRPFDGSRVLMYHDRAQFVVQWGRRATLVFGRLPCSDLRSELRDVRGDDQYRVRQTTVRRSRGWWVSDGQATILGWCEGAAGYGAGFAGRTDDWRLERRKVRVLVRALVPVSP